jgi:hypothetical protein
MTWSFVNKGGSLFAHPTTNVPIPAGIAAGDWRFAVWAGKTSENQTITQATTSTPVTQLGVNSYSWNGTTGFMYLTVFLNTTTTDQIRLTQSGGQDSCKAEEYAFRYSGSGVAVRYTEFDDVGPATFLRPPAVTVGANSLVLSVVALDDNHTFSLASDEGFTLRGQASEFGGTDMMFGVASKFVDTAQTVTMPNWQSSTPGNYSYATIVIGEPIPRVPGEPLGAITPVIEMAFGNGPLDDSPTWVDVSEFCTNLSIRRGRTSLLEDFEAGTGVLRLENLDARFDPSNTSGEYYPGVTMRCPVRISVDHNAVDYVVFRGMVESWPIEYGPGGYSSWCNAPIVDLTKTLAGFQLTAFDLSSADSVGDRIEAVLDEVGWPAGLRDIDAGLASRPDVTFTGPAIQLIRDEARADSGFFYVASDGKATYRGRTAYAGGNLINGTFGEAEDEIGYERLTVSYDDDRLYNIAVSSLSSGYDAVDSSMSEDELVTLVDTTSRDNFGPYRLEIESSFLNAAEGESAAQWAIARYKDQRLRVRSITLFPQFDEDNTYPQVLGRDLRDGLVVKFQPPGAGTPINQQVAVEWINHDATATSWVTEWGLEPLADIETKTFFELNVSELNDTDVLA